MKFNPIRAAIPLAFCALMAACGGGSSGTSGSSSGSDSGSSSGSSSGGDSGGGGGGSDSVVVTGTLVQALTSGATITAYAVNADGSAATTVLGTAQTDANGAFNLSLSLPSGASTADVLLVSSGGSYASEANTATTITNPDRAVLSVLLPQVGGSGMTGIVISPLTSFAASRAQGLIAGVSGATAYTGSYASCITTQNKLSCAEQTAEAGIEAAFGLSGATALTRQLPDFTASSGDGAIMAVVLGAFEEEALSQTQTPADLLDALVADYYDGVPDGEGVGGAAVTYPGTSTAIPSVLGTSLFLSAATTYVSDSAATPAAVPLAKPRHVHGNVTVYNATASNGITYDPSVLAAIRAGIASVAPASVQLTTSSSGAVSAINDSQTGHEIVLVAGRGFGLQGVDISTPTAPVLQDYSKLNTALARILPSVDGVTGITGLTDDEAVVLSFDSQHVVLVDLTTQTVLNDTNFRSQLVHQTIFSGGAAYVSSAISDIVAGTVLLSSADGYFSYDITDSTLSAPITLANSQAPAENLGGAVIGSRFPTNGLLFSGNYGDGSFGGGLQLVNLNKGLAYSMDADAFDAAFPDFGIIDGNSVDTVRNVGVISPEDNDYLGFVDLHDASKFTFTDSSASFTGTTASVFKLQTLGDGISEPVLSGTAVEPVHGLLFGLAAFSQTLLVGQMDNPAAPANGTWQGLTDWRYYNADISEYNSTASDPHAVGALLAPDGKSYGVALSINNYDSEDIVLVDLAAFLASPGSGTGRTHQLAGTPFTTPASIVQSIALTNSFSLTAAKSQYRKTHVQQHKVTIKAK